MRFTLKHTGPLRVWVRAEDQGGTIYEGWVSRDESFMFSGSIPNEKFQGSSVFVYINGILNAIFGVNCGDEYPGSTSGFFEITNIISKVGGVVCCAPGTNDASPPILAGCPSNKTATLAPNSCTVPVSWNEPTATDNCSVTWTKSHTPNSPFPYGVTTVTYIATDTYGNQSTTCSFTVTVNDVTAPVFNACPANVVRTADASCQAKGGWTPPTATDNGNCIPVITSTHSPNDLFSVGPPTLVTYTATDAKGNKSYCYFSVVVEDKSPPVFTNCPSVISAVASNSCPKVDLPIPILTDNCTDNPTYTSSHSPDTEFPIGETLVTYTSVDQAANSAVCTFLVVVSNSTHPIIENCPGTVTQNASTTEKDSVAVTWDEPTATVDCGEVFLAEQSHKPGSNFPIGTTPVTYTFLDEGGKSSECTFDVVVLPPDELFDISKAVTPDGDGINDVWLLTNIESFENNTVVVIDRWGNKIYQATGYDNVRTVWNGTNKNGTLVPTGTYFYTIEVRDQGKVVLKKGFIEVIQ